MDEPVAVIDPAPPKRTVPPWRPFRSARRLMANSLVWLLRIPGLSHVLVYVLCKLASGRFLDADYASGETALRLVLRVKEAEEDATTGLLTLYEAQGRLAEAALLVESRVKLFPDDIDVRLWGTRIYSTLGDMASATRHLEACSQLAPNSVPVLVGYGKFHRQNGRLEESSKSLASALEVQEDAEALCMLAENLVDEGNKAEAARLYLRAMQALPGCATAYMNLARLGHYDDPLHPDIQFMKSSAVCTDLPRTLQADLHFALGYCFERLARWDEAFSHFAAGNDLRWSWLRPVFSFPKWKELVDTIIDSFDEEASSLSQSLGSDKSCGEGLIFVVGMPRSGSTLVEQILGSHESVVAGGERNDVPGLVLEQTSIRNEPYPQWLHRMGRRDKADLAANYLARVAGLFKDHARLVDKQLHNYLHIGFLATILPGAKVIHCQRDALDNCTSCYCTNLPFLEYTHDLRTLGLVYRQYERLMKHWHSVLPGRVLDVAYESLVSEPEGQIRRLLNHCELSWRPECLTPYRTKRAVLTASAPQVKQPITDRSVGRWRNYEKHLARLLHG